MTKNTLQQLVLGSYNEDALDDVAIDTVASKLSRKELKQYIKALKNYEKKKNIFVDLPYAPTLEEQKLFQSLFPQRKIVYNVGDSIGTGVHIVNNDEVYDLTLKHTLDALVSYVESHYD